MFRRAVRLVQQAPGPLDCRQFDLLEPSMSLRALAAIPLLSLPIMTLAQEISYGWDIQPILTEKCVVCHACYDAPCQLNLGSGEGVRRGASKLPVYNGSRTRAQDTTRLYFDAQGEQAWRRKGFFSVLDGQAALLARMLELGRTNPPQPNARMPEELDLSINRDNQCPLPEEFDAYARKFAHAGMPFAVSGLSDAEYATLQRWLEEGAVVEEQALQPSAAEQRQIAEWEALLNAPGARESLLNRWLVEHVFRGRMYFERGEAGHFFQLVRSRTPSGQLIDPIATRRPNDDPGTHFHYRLGPIQGVIVLETHI